jgi:hypothetical protein
MVAVDAMNNGRRADGVKINQLQVGQNPGTDCSSRNSQLSLIHVTMGVPSLAIPHLLLSPPTRQSLDYQ